MTYGMTGAWDGWQSWHSSALTGEGSATPTSVQSSIELYLDAGIPPAKLGVGIGFYGACYTEPVTGPKQDLDVLLRARTPASAAGSSGSSQGVGCTEHHVGEGSLHGSVLGTSISRPPARDRGCSKHPPGLGPSDERDS